MMVGKNNVDHAAQGHGAADREIEPAGNQDHRLAEGDHAEHRDILKDVNPVPAGEEILRPEGKKYDQDDEDPADPEQHRTLSHRSLNNAPGNLDPEYRFHAAASSPAARASARAWLIEEPVSSPTSLPSRITRIRSLTNTTSSTSEVTQSTAVPLLASSFRYLWICARVPTSTPRVGSFSTSRPGRATSRLPSSTFCWLPPLSEETRCATERQRICRMSRHFSAIFRSATLFTKPTSENSRISMRLRVSWIVLSIRSPSPLRSGGT